MEHLEILSPLGMADYNERAAAVLDHCRRNLACVRTLFFPEDIHHLIQSVCSQKGTYGSPDRWGIAFLGAREEALLFVSCERRDI